jgi:lysophospholipase L1-like esterase
MAIHRTKNQLNGMAEMIKWLRSNDNPYTPGMSCFNNLRGLVFLATLAACGPSAVAAEAGIEAPVPTPVRFIKNLAAGKNQTVVTMGTSLTKGGAWVPQMKDLLEQKYPNLAKVVNLGRDASSTAAPKGRCGLDMVKAVVAAKPDAVFIEYGMNDCYLRYEITPAQSAKNLNTIIDTILAANPQTEVILQTMNSCKDYPEKNPPWLHASNRPKLADYYQIQRDIARKRNLRLIDHYPAWLAVMNNDPARFDKLVPDRIHPNAEGAREIIMPTLIKELGL